MQWLANTIEFLFPNAVIKGTPWENVWEAEQRQLFVRFALFFFPVVALAYIGHFFFYDRVAGLQPIEDWFAFRMSAAAICLFCFIFYWSECRNYKYYKIPALVTAALLCYSQARITVHHPTAPYIFCYLFVFVSSFMLRSSALNSFFFSVLLLSIQFPSLLEAGATLEIVLSGCILTVITCVITRSVYSSEVKNFMLTNERDQSNQKLIDATREFSDRLGSFIPKVIARRLQRAVNIQGMTVLEASVEVLRPQSKMITCLFSDIRGFTLGSKNLESFVGKSVLPEIKACSEAIETNEGIPRKIGDLIFAYFDGSVLEKNVVRAILSGIRIAELNKDINETLSEEEVHRYILIGSGEAIVGNIGGANSSVEITALGSPVNFLARLDDATKAETLAKQLNPGDLVLCSNTTRELKGIVHQLPLTEISLQECNVTIRDFPEVDRIYVLRPSDRVKMLLEDHFSRL